MNVDFNSCINNWCYQHGTMGQYTRCKSVSNNGRTCHNPEIKYGNTIGGKPGGNNGGTDWCKQLFPTTSIAIGTFKFKVTTFESPLGATVVLNPQNFTRK